MDVMVKPEEVAQMLPFIITQPWQFNINEVLFGLTQQVV